MIVVEPLPDYDVRTPLVKHRGFSHTLVFALCVGLVFGIIGALIPQYEAVPGTGLVIADQCATVGFAAIGFFFGTLGIVAHLAADVITPAGIPVLWPINKKRYSYDLVYAKDNVANLGLLFLGLAAVTLVSLVGLNYIP